VKSEYAKFIKQYKDVFAWSYNDLKTYDTLVIEHKIPLKHGIKHFRKKVETDQSYPLTYNRKRGQEAS
jgi:hypothetical protein